MKGFTLTIILTLFTVLVLQAEKRPIEFDDMFSMGRVSSERISPDGQWIAYTISKYDLTSSSRNTDIYLVSMDGQNHKRLTSHPKTDTSPRWSSDSKSIAFISTRGGSAQIYTILIDGGEAHQVSNIATGVGGFEWSPDNEKFLIVTEMLPEAGSPDESVEMENSKPANSGSGRVIDNLLYRHWNSWREGKLSHLVVVPVKGGESALLTPGNIDSPPISLGTSHDYGWSPNGDFVCYVSNPDEVVATSTNNDVWLVRPDGTGRMQLTTSKANDAGPRFSPDGRYIAYKAMKRPGFEADQMDLIVRGMATDQIMNLTEALDRYVSDFVWAPDGRKLYFYVPHHGRSRLYSVNRSGGEPELLLDGKYIGGISMAPDGNSLVIRHQRANLPYELFRFDINSKKMSQLTFTNKSLLAELDMPDLEDHWFTGANGDSVHMLMLKPPAFDSGKKYPLISLIHGGPQGAWSDIFHYRWNSEMFASPGYMVIMINFHGSRGYGQEFCDAVTHNWGGAPYEDVIIGTRWAIDQFDYIDGGRVGAAGASYGGFMINWIEGHNDDGLFKTLVSHDGVFEQVSMFGATEELWFPMWEFNGAPWEDGSLYDKWNPINHVDNFKTPMLVIHGEHDYRVPYTQGLQLFSALQVKGVESRLLFFPDEDHFVTKPNNARQWWDNVHEWLGRWLKP